LDDGSDSLSETVTYNPTPDGGATVTVKITRTYGTVSTDDNNATNGGSDSLTYNLAITPSGATAKLDEVDTDSYTDQETLAGPNGSGTWNSSGHDKYDDHESVTLNPDGTGTETNSGDSLSTDKYNLSLTANNPDGTTTTFTDSGNDKLTSDSSGTDDGQGSESDQYDNDVNSAENTTVGVNGNGLNATGTSTETVDQQDNGSDKNGVATETTTVTNDGNDSTNYHKSGTAVDGATYNVSDKKSDKYDDSDTANTGTSTGLTEEKKIDSSNSDDFNLNVAGVPDSGASDSITIKDSSTNTDHEDDVTAPDSSGSEVTQEEDDITGTHSDGASGTYAGGAFSSSGSGNDSSDITGTQGPGGYTQTGDTFTTSPPNTVTTGNLPGQSELRADEMAPSIEANQGITAGPAAMIASMTTTEVTPVGADPNPDPMPVDEGTLAQTQADFNTALAELQQNASFAKLHGRLFDKDGNPKQGFGYTVDLTSDDGVLGSTPPKGQSQKITIYLNRLEFRILRATDPANYWRLLKDSIAHETIHAFININGSSKVNGTDFDHHPSLGNNLKTAFGYPTNYGSLATYMNDRFPLVPSNKEVLSKHRMKYQGLFLDIDRASQKFIQKIVP